MRLQVQQFALQAQLFRPQLGPRKPLLDVALPEQQVRRVRRRRLRRVRVRHRAVVHSADEARKSAIAAGKDAAAAITASTEASAIAVTKKRQEEEARRKAAVEEKERNEDGRRARQLYRCGQAVVPCDPYEYTRWCMQSPINCQILENGREISAALDKSMDITEEFIGLGELEACLQNKGFSSCATLAGEVLVGAKAKALKNAYDALKLLKRGCKIAGATAKALQTAAAGKGCLEGKTNCDVLDPETGTRSPTSTCSRTMSCGRTSMFSVTGPMRIDS